MVDQVSNSLLLLLPTEIVSAELDLPLDLFGPILGFLLAIEVLTDCRVALQADNGAPALAAVFVLSLVDGCHLKPLSFMV